VESEAPGWDSISAAFAAAYPGVKPLHMATTPPGELGAALDGIGAYRGPHGWHYVTYGLTELYDKHSENADESGWGYELTLLTPAADEPPRWPFRLLLGLAQRLEQDGRWHDVGHRIDLGEPLDGGGSGLTALAVAKDPHATPADFPFGRYAFLRLVGITGDELREMQATSTADVLARFDPALVTDPLRTPISA
jgi:suppressor of fused-like protein